jgi:TonB family protein
MLTRARKLRYALASLLLCFMGLTAAAADQSVEATLNSQYAGKILALRHPLEKNSQAYDAAGKVLKGGDEGSWTLYGRFLVKKVRVEKSSVVIEGQRLVYVRAGSSLAPTQSRTKLKMEINFDKAPASAEEANGLLGHVFALTDEDVVRSAPRIWQSYLSTQLLHTPANESDADSATPAVQKLTFTIVEIDADGSVKPGKKRVEMREGVTRPRAKFTPEPEFTEVARKERYQGELVLEMIVDNTGKIRAANILRPLGMGLDENAVKSILTWRFDPARVDGKPVAVQMHVEVAFHLY